MLELNHRTELVGRAERRLTSGSNPQNFRLMIALSILIVALGVVLVKDRDFWFGSEQATEADSTPENVVNTVAPAVTANTVKAPVTRSAAGKHNATAKTAAQAAPLQQPATDQSSPVVATNRVVLPPLDVEVIAGDTHRTVRSGSVATKVEIPSDSNRAPVAASSNLPAEAAEREHLTPVAVPELRSNVASAYPMLAQHMKVQGSVVLQAIIGADGSIENLRVLSGPAILATAAQQAVRQWRFKPVLQNGQPVETKTKITVNFSIHVADNTAANS